MLLFYHGIGFILMLVGSSIAENVISDYKEPSVPRSPLLVISAGPIEETLFFGIPFYIFGNHFVVLATGIVWAMMHILNTGTLDIRALAYANWLFVIPSLFFSLRTWISGKGWFAIVTHSAWNGLFFVLGCTSGEFLCVENLSGGKFVAEISNIMIAGILLILTYMIYCKRRNNL
jgi:membrane protease YdiL (CAAX protease family)